MNQTIQAIFEDGVFKPLYPITLKLAEGEKVRITIEKKENSDENLSLNQKYFKGLSEEYLDDVITHALEDSEKD
ncbi:MAG: antitoxin family protein [Pyrinomonadaceae bacterium]